MAVGDRSRDGGVVDDQPPAPADDRGCRGGRGDRAAYRPPVGALVPLLRLARRRGHRAAGAVARRPGRRLPGRGGARPARGAAARLRPGRHAARAGHAGGAGLRAVRRPAPGHAGDLRRRRQLAGQPQAPAAQPAAGALRDRHRAGRRGDRAAPAHAEHPAGPRRPGPARRRHRPGQAAAAPPGAGARGHLRPLAGPGRRHGHPRLRPRGHGDRRRAAYDGGPGARRALRRRGRRLRPARPDRPAAAGRSRCWWSARSSRSPGWSTPDAGCNAPATAPTGGAPPSWPWSSSASSSAGWAGGSTTTRSRSPTRRSPRSPRSACRRSLVGLLGLVAVAVTPPPRVAGTPR